MKNIIYAFTALVFASSAAMAQNTNTNTSGSDATAGSNSSLVYAPKGAKGAASAIAPSYNPGFGSCRSGIPIGGAGGGFGFSFGIPLDDAKCDTREDARYIAQLTGNRDATKERLCDTPKIRDAFARAGSPCRGDRVVASAPAYTRNAGNPVRVVSADARSVKLQNCLKRQRADASVKCGAYR